MDPFEQLIRDHLNLVHAIVRDVGTRLPAHVDRDDLTGAGMVGLVQAAKSYDPNRGVPFAPWARIRVKGAIIDQVRAGARLRETPLTDRHDSPSTEYGPEALAIAAAQPPPPDPWAAVGSLPDKQALIIRRYYRDG